MYLIFLYDYLNKYYYFSLKYYLFHYIKINYHFNFVLINNIKSYKY